MLERLILRAHASGIRLGEEIPDNPVSILGSGTAKRQLTPVAQLKTGREKPSSDGLPLSYESALRAHARYQPAAHPPVTSLGGIHSGLNETESAASTQTSASAKGSSATKRRMPAHPENRSPVPAKVSASPKVAAPVKDRTRSRPREILAARKESEEAEIRSSAPAGGTASRHTQLRTTDRSPVQNPDRNTVQNAVPGISKGSLQLGPNKARRRSNPHSISTEDRTPIAPSAGNYSQDCALVLERKQATVSIRLSHQESEQLRLRAAESGMTVSAYMRSCVLEAEHLRTQVKQALAELRTRTQDLDTIRLPAPPEPEKSGGWLRLFAKPVAFFFGPLFPLRRNA